MISLPLDYPDRASINRSIRKQKQFTIIILAILSELSLVFSLSLSMPFDIQTIAMGILFYISITVFWTHYLRAVREAEHSTFWHLKIIENGKAKEHVLKVKWPVTELGSIGTKVRQTQATPADAAQLESSRLFMGYYVNNYAGYLKKKDASPSIKVGTSSPSFKYIFQPTEHYYFDEDTLKSFDSGKKPELSQAMNGSPLIEKQDSLYFALLTLVTFSSTIVNLFLGKNVLASSLPFLLCLFGVPFYRGYLKGSLRADFANRLKGWENLVLILLMFLFLVFPLEYASFLFLGVLFLTSTIPAQLLPFFSVQLFALILVGVVFFLLVMVAVMVCALAVRVAAVKLTKIYFDNSPSRRADILRGIMFAGDIRSIQVNAVLSAMLHRQEIELSLGSEHLKVQNSMVNSERFIRGCYCKGWNWFLDIYVLCLTLASTFVLLLRFL